MGLVNGRDVAGQRAPTGLMTWRRRGWLTGLVGVDDDGGVDVAGLGDVAWSMWVASMGYLMTMGGGSRRGMTWVVLVVDLVPDPAWRCASIHEGGE
jgi:hypothetical protein